MPDAFEPGQPSADADGFRGDVLELVRELGPTTVRPVVRPRARPRPGS